MDATEQDERERPLHHFRPITGHARWLTWLFVALIVVNGANIAAGLHQNRVLESDYTLEQVEMTDTLVLLATIPQTVLYVALAIVFIRWMRRAYRNLPALGAEGRRFKSKWAILGWFVPIMNWFRPKQIINDIWRATDPEAPEHQGNAWHGRSVPGYLLAWWLVLLLSDRVAQAAVRSSLTNAFGENTGDPIEALTFENVIYAWSDGVDILAAFLAILVVGGVTRRHDARVARLGIGASAAGGDDTPPPPPAAPTAVAPVIP